ncbi:response regulator transcription factor, partial [bacterium]|nr:response regulator transcription factor [bacterium]
MKVFIADDHTLIREGVKRLLLAEYPHIQFGEASDFQELKDKITATNWDLVFLDIHMPNGNILDSIQFINQLHAKTPILVLSISPEDQYAVRLVRAGAKGYITKESIAEELSQAVKRVLEGKTYISTEFSAKLVDGVLNESQKHLHEFLSDREFQVFLMIASGNSLKEIANQLSISAKTVGTYRSR